MNRGGALLGGRLELLRLWASYQRYALLLGLLALCPLLAAAAVAPSRGIAWAAAIAVALPIGRFAAAVYRRWPQKIRATMLAIRRIESGRFTPRFVTGYCADPCFRLVADEILARAGHDRRHRKALIRELREDCRRPFVLMIVDRDNTASPVRVEGLSLKHVPSRGDRG